MATAAVARVVPNFQLDRKRSSWVNPFIRILLLNLIGFSSPELAHAAAETTPKGLADCFTAALARSEVIADQTEQIRQAEERYQQAVGAMLPTLGGVASYGVQQASAAGNFAPSSQPLIKLSLTQPVF